LSEIRFLPSYVGSKQYWVSRLQDILDGRPIVELFAGSAVLSANFATRCILVDTDPMVTRILENFDKQIVPEVFTQEDYFAVRASKEWWRYAYCLQKMSFSGVFRYSKNGYNVPVKKNIQQISVRADYDRALKRWIELSPFVLNTSYTNVSYELINLLGDDVVVVLDPPYEDSQAHYNRDGFNYTEYWSKVKSLRESFDVLAFDRESNIIRQGFEVSDTRKMRVNGAREGDSEAFVFFCKSGLTSVMSGTSVEMHTSY